MSKKRKHVEIQFEFESKEEKLKTFKEQYSLIEKHRENKDAPVDLLGAKATSDDSLKPEIFRYQLLIGVLISSQTKDEVSSVALQKLRDSGLTIDEMLKLEEKDIQGLLYPVSFYKRKAGYILITSKILKDKYGGDVPKTEKEVLKLPGIGPKMVPVFMKNAWGKVIGIGVDGHVHRICNRLAWVKTSKAEETETKLKDFLPKEYWDEFGTMVSGFGQQICKPQNPSCDKCSLNQIVHFSMKQIVKQKNKSSSE
eukprot:gene9005-1104_t